MKDIHGHKVIDFIDKSHPRFLREELLSKIEKEFGDARFHTCSQSNLTAIELVTFLESAGKLHFIDGAATINKANVCDHDE